MQKDYGTLYAEIELERKENKPKNKELASATVIAVNQRGLYVDINKTYEGFINSTELGSKQLNEYQVNDKIDVFVLSEPGNEGIFKLSLKQLEQSANWNKLKELQNQNLEVTVSKIVKSGIEVQLPVEALVGFIPFKYIDYKFKGLESADQQKWLGKKIPAKIHELDEAKNKIILNHKVISEELRKIKAEGVLNGLSVGQDIEGQVVRITDFGVFADVGGVDALIPASELSWQRFGHPSEVVNIGDAIKAKVFRVNPDEQKVAISVKQVIPNPWSIVGQQYKVGTEVTAKVVTQANFGTFVQVAPGVEALLHSSNFKDGQAPEIGTELELTIINLDVAKQRMGVNFRELDANSTMNEASDTEDEDKELEHA